LSGVPVPNELTPFALGRALGFDRTETFDLDPDASVQLDLHETPPAEYRGQFDCVIDAGTIFFCSDPGAALRSAFRLAAPGALVAHVSGVTGFFGRAYYNVHPALFIDFWEANGGRLLRAGYRTTLGLPGPLMHLANIVRLNRASATAERTARYVSKSRPNKIVFGDSRKREPGILPNNAVGTLLFEKGQEREQVVMPVPAY
jgi:hypothetical protein